MESYRIVNQVPTKVLTFGKGVGDDLFDVRNLVVVFPGNPGVIDFYREFMKELYIRLKAKYPKDHIPVWGISHAGHQTEGLHEFTFPQLADHPELYNLEGQYAHKVKFLESFVPPHIKVIGIGHSIGCKMWLETAKRLEENSTPKTIAEPKKRPSLSKIFMLFPTIERMRHTPNGQRVLPFLKYFRLVSKLLWPITLIPTFMQRWLVNFHFRGQNVPDCAYPATMQLFNYDIINRISYLAKCELEQVVELDTPAVEKHLDKLTFYFGAKDGWCPVSFAGEMIEKFPGLSHKICENGYEHAFVLESSLEMAEFVCNQIAIPAVKEVDQSADRNKNEPE